MSTIADIAEAVSGIEPAQADDLTWLVGELAREA